MSFFILTKNSVYPKPAGIIAEQVQIRVFPGRVIFQSVQEKLIVYLIAATRHVANCPFPAVSVVFVLCFGARERVKYAP
jgi:hypothetical protein